MKIQVLSCLCAATLITITSCKHSVVTGSGVTKTETRSVQQFKSIIIEASLKSSITVDSATGASLQLNGYENLLSYIKTEVNGDILRIYTDKPINFDSDKDIVVTITTSYLNGLTIKGMGESQLHGVVKSDQFSLVLSGAGDVTIDNIDVDRFNANIEGAGSLAIQGGKMNIANYELKGAGDVNAYSVTCNESKAELLGAGDLELNVAQKLDAEIKGAGSISYKGHPAVTKKVLGVGSIEEAN